MMTYQARLKRLNASGMSEASKSRMVRVFFFFFFFFCVCVCVRALTANMEILRAILRISKWFYVSCTDFIPSCSVSLRVHIVILD